MVSEEGERRRRDVLLHVCLIELDPDPDMSIMIAAVVVRGEGEAGELREEAKTEDLRTVSERVDAEEVSSPGRLLYTITALDAIRPSCGQARVGVHGIVSLVGW